MAVAVLHRLVTNTLLFLSGRAFHRRCHCNCNPFWLNRTYHAAKISELSDLIINSVSYDADLDLTPASYSP
jgi:hypothetical protein